MAASTTEAATRSVAGPRRWPLSRVVQVVTFGTVLLVAVAGVTAGLGLQRLSASRQSVIDVADPAEIQVLQLDADMINQETGVRGYALSGTASFLQPFVSGLASERGALVVLRGLLNSVPGARSDIAVVTRRIGSWQTRYATPTIAQVRAGRQPVSSTATDQGKAEFDALRASIAVLQGDISRYRQQAVAGLDNAARTLRVVIIAIGLGLLLIVTLFVLAIRHGVVRPIAQLAADARQAAAGNFEHVVQASGPRETVDLGADVNRMRERIVTALTGSRAAEAELRELTEELRRSNAELEQFAYVASHDLQEPLRKVTSFCQLLQRRYSGQLDDRADLYIEYAVDGAQRMQQLINDLLAFSRVGRIASDQVPVSSSEAFEQACANLSEAITKAHASIEPGRLPVVRAEATLLTTVFQNLLSNALKFHGDDPPHISVSADRADAFWQFSVTDNGIGVDPQYSERIFVLFQRLHDRQAYPGTGIGLAMCRKIVEYHGGRMWLDSAHSPGARFCFTLPAMPEDEDADG
jgi:signal transduction histidine kinase